MSVMKVIELMAESSKSWEDAAQQAVNKASKSVRGIKTIWLKDFAATVDEKGNLETYRVTCKLTFAVKD